MKYLQDYNYQNNSLKDEVEINTEVFSNEINLFDYQKEAINKTVSYLLNYYEEDNNLREHLPNWLFENEIGKGLKEKENLNLNMLSYWMATGSGKTIVIVKLIELLKELYSQGLLYQNNEREENDIIFLTEREDLIRQFKDTVNLFNKAGKSKYQIILKSLKEHPAYSNKQNSIRVFEDEIIVYYYKSGSLREKEKISKKDKKDAELIDYTKLLDKNININLIIDEAHKGSVNEDSKRFKQFFEIAEKGFVFNFSATLTDKNQRRMSIIKFDITEYIQKGYGKKLQIISNKVSGFKNNVEKDTETDKNIEILKSFILLTYIKKSYEELKKTNIYKEYKYHNPMIVILTNSVNTNNSDLKMVFEMIFKSIDSKIFDKAKEDLQEDLQSKENTYLSNNKEEFNFNENLYEKINIKDIHKYVYNRGGEGSKFEYKSPNEKEILLKYNNTEKDFALIKVGETKDLKSNFLEEEYQISETKQYSKESEFEKLENSNVNILIGSRSFYEGWDSLRPNIILYINIGSKDAKKYGLQSIGRGIRLSPDGKNRKRLQFIKNKNVNTDINTNILETLICIIY